MGRVSEELIELSHNQCLDVAMHVFNEYQKWLNNGKGKIAIYPFDQWLIKQKRDKQ